ncbi:MAG TPA: protoporphyrinogen oxidase, partial [Microbacteriaceae bacterium]|nr:protoporphyrinogen oxidase [Microbacteriaceae bacterium]
MTGPTAAESQGRAAGPAAQRAPHAAVGNDRLPPTRVLVIGGGAAGLVAAWDCARPGFEVTLVEASERTGGSVAAHEVAGVTLDVGAESFATRGGAVEELLGDLGLRDRIVAPNPAGAWLHAAGRSVPLPRGGMLGIPASPLARDVIAAIGWRGALRAYADRLVPVMKIGREENLARLVARRMGRAVLDDLVAPVVTGVYSTPVEDLDVEAAVPGLNGALTRAGSLSGAVAELRLAAARRAKEAGTGSKPGSAVLGLQGGMHTLVAALVEGLRARGGRIVTGTRALAVRPLSVHDEGQTPPAFGPGWRVETAGGESLTADAVVVAAPQAEAVALLAEASEAAVGLAALAWPQAGRVDIVTLVLDQPALDAAPRGT